MDIDEAESGSKLKTDEYPSRERRAEDNVSQRALGKISVIRMMSGSLLAMAKLKSLRLFKNWCMLVYKILSPSVSQTTLVPVSGRLI